MKRQVIYILIISIFLLSHTDRNYIKVEINSNDQILVEHEQVKLAEVSSKIKYLLRCKEPNCAELKLKSIPHLGEVYVSKAIIGIGSKNGTSYNMYIQVQNEVEKAINDLRDEMSNKYFNETFSSLDGTRKEAITQLIPKRISDIEYKVIEDVHGNPFEIGRIPTPMTDINDKDD